MLDTVGKLELTASALKHVKEEHKNLNNLREEYVDLVDDILAEKPVSPEIVKVFLATNDYIAELENYIFDLTNLVVEFGLGKAQQNSEAMSNLIKSFKEE